MKKSKVLGWILFAFMLASGIVAICYDSPRQEVKQTCDTITHDTVAK